MKVNITLSLNHLVNGARAGIHWALMEKTKNKNKRGWVPNTLTYAHKVNLNLFIKIRKLMAFDF